MSSTTTIYQEQIIESSIVGKQILLTEIVSFYSNDLSDNMLQYALGRMWHLESECGALFELAGEDIIDKFLPRLQQLNKNINKDSFDRDSFYKVEISY